MASAIELRTKVYTLTRKVVAATLNIFDCVDLVAFAVLAASLNFVNHLFERQCTMSSEIVIINAVPYPAQYRNKIYKPVGG